MSAFQLKTMLIKKLLVHFNGKCFYFQNWEVILIENTHAHGSVHAGNSIEDPLTYETAKAFQLKTLILYLRNCEHISVENTRTYKTVQTFQLKTLLLTKLRKHFNWKHSYCTYRTAKYFNWKHSYLQNSEGFSIENTHTYKTVMTFQLKTLLLTKLRKHVNWKHSYLQNCDGIFYNWKHSSSRNSERISIENPLSHETAKLQFWLKTLIPVLMKLRKHFIWKHSYFRNWAVISIENTHAPLLKNLWAHFNWKH